MRVRILEREIGSVEGAFASVVKYESFPHGSVEPDVDDGSRHRVRAVAQPEKGESNHLNDEWKSRIEDSIAKLAGQVEASLNVVLKKQQVTRVKSDGNVGRVPAVMAGSRPPAQGQRNRRRGAPDVDLGDQPNRK